MPCADQPSCVPRRGRRGVRKPAFFRAARFASRSIAFRARATPRRIAPAWPVVPPPSTRTIASNLPSSLSRTIGELTSRCSSLAGKYSSRVRPLMVHLPVPGPGEHGRRLPYDDRCVARSDGGSTGASASVGLGGVRGELLFGLENRGVVGVFSHVSYLPSVHLACCET